MMAQSDLEISSPNEETHHKSVTGKIEPQSQSLRFQAFENNPHIKRFKYLNNKRGREKVIMACVTHNDEGTTLLCTYDESSKKREGDTGYHFKCKANDHPCSLEQIKLRLYEYGIPDDILYGSYGPPAADAVEVMGNRIKEALIDYVVSNDGDFLRDGEGKPYVVLEGEKVDVTDTESFEVKSILIKATGKTKNSKEVSSGLDRFALEVYERAGRIKVKKFAAVSKDEERVYYPQKDRSLLMVTADKIEAVPNGNNEDGFWVEPIDIEGVYEDQPFTYDEDSAEEGLRLFEELIINTQTVADRDHYMHYLVGIIESILPMLREFFKAVMIIIHVGAPGSGKTTGARRPLLLHGFPDVLDDVTPAALAEISKGGQVVLDNKENKAYEDDKLFNFLLTISTSSLRVRSFSNGGTRSGTSVMPLVTLTSVDGPKNKTELLDRIVEVDYHLDREKQRSTKKVDKDIIAYRDAILSGLMKVIQRFLQVKSEDTYVINPVPRFEDYWRAFSKVVAAYADVSGKPEGWAEEALKAMDTKIKGIEKPADELDSIIKNQLDKWYSTTDLELTRMRCTVYEDREYRGKKGRLYVTTAQDLLNSLKESNSFFRSSYGTSNETSLGKRLKSTRFESFVYIPSQERGKEPEIEEVRRKGDRRPIAFFIEK